MAIQYTADRPNLEGDFFRHIQQASGIVKKS